MVRIEVVASNILNFEGVRLTGTARGVHLTAVRQVAPWFAALT